MICPVCEVKTGFVDFGDDDLKFGVNCGHIVSLEVIVKAQKKLLKGRERKVNKVFRGNKI